jgi:FGGY family of carbohydrate kinases, C-terminal domain
MASTSKEILRAAMEAVALRFARVAEKLDEAFPEEADSRDVVATGGGLLGSRTWTRIMADALGRPITASAVPEVSSRGRRPARHRSARGTRDRGRRSPLGETYEPDLSRHAVYKEGLAHQREVYETVARRGVKGAGPGGRYLLPPGSPRLDTERVFSLAAAPVALVQGNVVGFAGAGVDLAWAGDLKLLIVH